MFILALQGEEWRRSGVIVRSCGNRRLLWRRPADRLCQLAAMKCHQGLPVVEAMVKASAP